MVNRNTNGFEKYRQGVRYSDCIYTGEMRDNDGNKSTRETN